MPVIDWARGKGDGDVQCPGGQRMVSARWSHEGEGPGVGSVANGTAVAYVLERDRWKIGFGQRRGLVGYRGVTELPCSS